MCCTRLVGNTGRKKSPFAHHRTTLSGYIFATKARIDNRKNLLNSISTSAHSMANLGTRTAEIGSGVCGTPANFNGFRVLAALLHGTLVLCVSQTLRRWTEGATYIRQGGHHVGHWLIMIVCTVYMYLTVSALPFLLPANKHVLVHDCSALDSQEQNAQKMPKESVSNVTFVYFQKVHLCLQQMRQHKQNFTEILHCKFRQLYDTIRYDTKQLYSCVVVS